MDVGSSDLISSNEFGSTVCLHMILVSKVALAIVFDPFGIGIFLTELIFFPRFRYLPFFEFLIFFPAVTLNGYFHDRSIHQLAFMYDNAICIQELIQVF